MRLHALQYCILGFLICISSVTYGATTDFTVRTLIGGDTTPPSIPTGLIAIPVATSQIDLAWGTSTDDVILSGYRVYRDDVNIATTTLASYSDIGLIASTTYTYYVTSFDSFMNVSASSTVVSTTTLSSTTPPTPTPAPTAPNGPQYGSIVRLAEIISLRIIPSQTGAVIRYETSGHVRSVVKWGTSISYELGSVAERSFSKFHETSITDLNPDTQYKFSIQGENNIGRFGTLTESTFRTLSVTDTIPPSNVFSLSAREELGDVILAWQNPPEQDFDHVRILRSEKFYPSDTADGWVVYEGNGESVRDKGALKDEKTQYYTVFTYDALGNISSGAVVRVAKKSPQGEPEIDISEENSMQLTVDQITLMQDNIRIPFQRGTAVINGGKHLTISIPYSALPEHLKTILVTLTSPQDTSKELNFLLRVDTDKTAYVAHLAPLGTAGHFPLRIAIFDFKTSQIGFVRGRITSEIISYDPPVKTNDTSDSGAFMNVFQSFSYVWIWIFIIGTIILAFLTRRILHRSSPKSPHDKV